MRPAAAIAWEFRRRHRWGLLALRAYFVALVTINVLAGTQRIRFESDTAFALAVVVPLTSMALYFLAVFTFGLAGDIAARQSMYPARMFTLPVTNAALAGWPMLYGSIAMAMLWLVTRLLGAWPAGVDVPVFWPLLFGPAILAWTQALTWMPYPLPGLRVVATVFLLCSIDAVVLAALELKAPEGVMVAILVPHVPLAYLVARFAVARARRGDVPEWRLAWQLDRRRREPFPSAARAQVWFEWRQHGRSLPVLVAILLPFELSLLHLFRDTPVIVFKTLVGVLLTPAFMAIFVAATVRKPNLAFIATRPLTSASLVAAKLKVTIWSTVMTWLLVLAAIPIALRVTGAEATVLDWARRMVASFGAPHSIVFALLVLVLLAASTWKQLVQSLYLGMSGREWVVKASVFAALAVLAVALPLAEWVFTRKDIVALLLWTVLPWVAAILVCAKLIAAVWIAARLHETRLVRDRTILLGAAAWDVAVFALYGLLLWLLPTIIFRTYLLALIAIFEVPLARLSAAPLALARNRHR